MVWNRAERSSYVINVKRANSRADSPVQYQVQVGRRIEARCASHDAAEAEIKRMIAAAVAARQEGSKS